MKNLLVLIVIFLLQSLFYNVIACENSALSMSTSAIAENYVKIETIHNSHLESNSNDKKQSNEQNHDQCKDCKVCLHLLIILNSEKINFLSNYNLLDVINIKSIYQPPFLYFSKKPPIKV